MRTYFGLLIFAISIINCQNGNKVKTPNNFAQNVDLKKSQEEGQLIYEDFCITCHLPNWLGVPKAFPPLANSDYLKQNQEASIKAIKYGLSGEIKVNGVIYNTAMAPLGLSDKEIADVMNYINNAWGNSIDNVVTEAEVSKISK